MRPEQLGEIAIPSDPRLHPDRERIVFVVTRLDLEDDEYKNRIWVWDDVQARPLTAGPADTSPRWSPDGSRLAFLRKGPGDDDKPQLAILDMAGGEAEVVTDFQLGVLEAEWSPDGRQIAVVAAEWIPELADLESDERKRRPRRVVRFPYRFDNVGWVADRRTHLYLVDTHSKERRQLTAGDFDESGIAWHPDGDRIAFLSARHEQRGLDAGTQAWTIDASGGTPVPQTTIGLWATPSFDPAGRLHVVGTPDRWRHPDVMPLWRIESDGGLTNLTGHLDRNIVPLAPTVAPAGPQWLDDGGAILTVEDSGSIRLMTMRGGQSIADLLGGERAITGASPDSDGSRIAFVATTPTNP
nr:hypothetical protein [Acidimicrobiia bacterium]